MPKVRLDNYSMDEYGYEINGQSPHHRFRHRERRDAPEERKQPWKLKKKPKKKPRW